MLFQSFDFLLFFPLFTVLYFLLPVRHRWWWVLLTSYAFYAFWNPWYLLLLFASTLTDFYAALAIAATADRSKKKRWLAFSLTVNLGLLAIFKYYDFFAEQFAWFIRWSDPDFSPYLLEVVLPVGISFYTFQTIGYTVDVYRGRQLPVRQLGYFANYVSFFPQLVAGPIERAKDLLPQLHFNYRFDSQRVTEGLRLFLWGLFKKLVVADRLGLFVGAVFTEPGAHGGGVVLLAGYLFFFQIYYDFSAYQDMAVGTARILGVRLSDNFKPLILLSSSAIKFWQGWHMTLTRWIGDYAYRLFGMHRAKIGHVMISPLFIFFLVGLWHGANWTYILWGVLNGIFLIVERELRGVNTVIKRFFGKKIRNGIGFFFFFNAFTFANIFFCSSSVSQGWHFLQSIVLLPTTAWNPGMHPIDFALLWIVLFFSVLFEYSHRHLPPLELLHLRHPALRWLLYLILGWAIWFLRIPEDLEFIYFEF
ncbi:MAG: MBOAT family O-acyltransferase [Lewinella sp.]|jgi:D-alanyl-lipoteichoic acid acyltransferase DltB (MBOAT superfamily)|uniref:MBOAT family O-acyltransferase n=1 Tax=Lewinella sp. TaxID=2004506 RepID=UPI003D6AB095